MSILADRDISFRRSSSARALMRFLGSSSRSSLASTQRHGGDARRHRSDI